MKFTLISSALITTALAATHQVTIGPGLVYSPNSLTAATGDVVAFKFGSGHNVVSGSFGSPCQPDGKVYSGDGSDGDVFSVTINSTDPLWLYCSIPHHCQAGMVMVINPSGHTLDDYKSAAASAGSSSQPNSVVGGVYGSTASSSSSASSSSAMMTSSRTASSSASATSSSSKTSSSSSAANGAQSISMGVMVGLGALWSLVFA